MREGLITRLDHLKNVHGIPARDVAKRIGVNSDNLAAARAGRAKSKVAGLIKLIDEAFPDLDGELAAKAEKSVSLNHRLRTLAGEVEVLKKQNAELKEKMIEENEELKEMIRRMTELIQSDWTKE